MPRRILYVAYPMRLDLRAANAIQTYNTVKELRKIAPGTRLVVPRWLREPSAFAAVGALHLPRPGANKLSRLLPWGGWSYIERTLYSWLLVVLLAVWKVMGRGYRTIYVRDAVCAAWLSLLAGRLAAVVYEVHDLESEHPSKASRWPKAVWARFLPWVDSTALRRACKVVSLTETFRDWLVSNNVRTASEVVVIPDAFDPQMYGPVTKEEARARLGLPERCFIVGYAGLTFAYRRLDLLVDAFARMSEIGENALLVLVGGRPAEVEEIRGQSHSLGIAEARLVTPGQVDHEAAALYVQASDVLVIPDTVTQMTASPLKLFEYMAAGRAIILKDMAALREVVDEECALFFPEGDVEGLSRALEELYRNPERAGALGRAARARSERYTYRARAEKIAAVIRSCS